MNARQKQILLGYITNPRTLVEAIFIDYLTNLIHDDKLYIKLVYRLFMRKRLDLDNPSTFQEKLQWLKLFDRRSEYSQMVDKYEAKKYVADRIGDEYIIPTYGIWDDAKDITFDSLPSQFVMKCTHDSGKIIICKDKSKLDIGYARRRMKGGLSKTFWKRFREYPYRDVKPRIIAEELLPCKEGADIPDYKFYCFNGEPMYCQVIRDRRTCETIDFYDMDWKHQDFVGLNPVARNGITPVASPGRLDEMKEICRKLSKDIPFVRVDLYYIEGKIFFGELTFFPGGGVGVFTPGIWDKKIGDLIKLPNKKTLDT